MEVIKCKWLRRFVEKRTLTACDMRKKREAKEGWKDEKEKREPYWKIR